MIDDFDLKKPLPSRPQAERSIEPTAEQVALVHWINGQMLQLLLEYLDETGQNAVLASDLAFRHVPVDVGVEVGCVVLLELLDVPPKLIWSDEDLAILQRVPMDSLRAMCCALAYFVTKRRSFTRLTA